MATSLPTVPAFLAVSDHTIAGWRSRRTESRLRPAAPGRPRRQSSSRSSPSIDPRRGIPATIADEQINAAIRRRRTGKTRCCTRPWWWHRPKHPCAAGRRTPSRWSGSSRNAVFRPSEITLPSPNRMSTSRNDGDLDQLAVDRGAGVEHLTFDQDATLLRIGVQARIEADADRPAAEAVDAHGKISC